MRGLSPGSRLRTLAVGACAALMAVACAQGGGGQSSTNLAKDQVYRVNIITEPKVLDPGQTQYAYEAAVDRQLFEPLLRPKFDSSGSATDVTGAAAESYSVSSDNLTYTFKLRKNNWSDGQPVTAKDFVYAWKRILDPTLAAPYADPFFDGAVAGAQDYSKLDPKKDAAKVPAFLQGLGVSAPDDSTFVVKVQQPTPYFKWIASLWMGAPVRQDVVQKYGSDKWGAVDPAAAQSLVSNGPFRLSELAPQDHMTAVPNRHYTGKKPTLTKLTYYYISDDNQGISRFRTGELDLQRVPFGITQQVKSDPQLSKAFHQIPSLNTFWVGFNTKKPPFDNPKVRQAFTQAVDRTKLQEASFGRLVPNPTFIPKGMPGYSTQLQDVQKFDASAAKQTLKDAGVDPATLNVSFLNRNITDNITIAQVLQDQWKTNLGVNVAIDTQESKTVSKLQTAGNYQFSLQGWLADYPDQQDWYDIWTCGSGNQFSGYCNKQYDTLVTKADSTTDAAQRDKLYLQAEEILLKDNPGGMLYTRSEVEVIQTYVKGLTTTPLDDDPPLGSYFFPDISIASH
jgi:oligopeptide transport system substrate-binding protein